MSLSQPQLVVLLLTVVSLSTSLNWTWRTYEIVVWGAWGASVTQAEGQSTYLALQVQVTQAYRLLVLTGTYECLLRASEFKLDSESDSELTSLRTRTRSQRTCRVGRTVTWTWTSSSSTWRSGRELEKALRAGKTYGKPIFGVGFGLIKNLWENLWENLNL